MTYKIVYSDAVNFRERIKDLEEKVNGCIQGGYVPYRDLIIEDNSYFLIQVMLYKKDTE